MVAAREFDEEYPKAGSLATWAAVRLAAVMALLIFE
jgi:hypothetical protein